MHCVGAAKESMKRDNEDWWWTRWIRCCVQCRDAQSKVWMHDLWITRICISLQLSASHIVSQCISLHHSANHCIKLHLVTTQYILCIPFLCIPLLCTRQGQAALAAWAGCRRAGVDEVAFVLCTPGHFDGSGGFVFFYKYRGVKRIWLNTRPFKFQTGWV